MNKEKFLYETETAINKVLKLPKYERFDKLCELIDNIYDRDKFSAYIRIFYDCGDPICDIADELLDLGERFEIKAYKVVYTTDFDTIVVVLHERTPKDI